MYSQSGENGGQRALQIFDRRQMDDAARDRCATSVALRVLSAGAGADNKAVAEASLPVSRQLLMKVPPDVLRALRHVGDGEPSGEGVDAAALVAYETTRPGPPNKTPARASQ